MTRLTRAQHREVFAVVRCQFRGTTYSRATYIWVDKDFATAARATASLDARGFHPGAAAYPLGRLAAGLSTRVRSEPSEAPSGGTGSVDHSARRCA